MVYKIRRKTVQKPNNNNNNNNNNINHKNNYDNLGVAHPQSGSSSHISGRLGIQLEPLVFEERGNAGYPEKNLSEQWREPTKDSWSTHKAGIWTRATSVGCECSHHCARTLALYKQKNDGLLWGAITLINCLLINFFCYYSRIQPFSLFYLWSLIMTLSPFSNPRVRFSHFTLGKLGLVKAISFEFIWIRLVSRQTYRLVAPATALR